MGTRPRIVALLAALLFATAGSVVWAQTSELRLVHLSTGLPEIDMTVGDTLVGDSVILTERLVGYAEASRILPYDTGLTRIRLAPSNDPNNLLVAGNVSLSAAVRTNVIVLNTAAFVEAATLTFSTALEPEPNTVHLRVMNAMPEAGRFDVAVTDNTGNRVMFENIGFKSATAFQPFATGIIEVEVFRAGTGERVVYGIQTLDDGLYGTVFIGGVESKPDVRMLDETDTLAQSPLVRFGNGRSAVRLVNAIPMSFFSRSRVDTVAVPIGLRSISATRAVDVARGTREYLFDHVIDTVVKIPGSIDVSPNTLYTVVARGRRQNDYDDPVVLEHPFESTWSADSAYVRFVHVGSSLPQLQIQLVDGRRKSSGAALAYGESNSHRGTAPGRFSLILSDQSGTVLARRSADIAAGEAVTIILHEDSATGDVNASVLVDSHLPFGIVRPTEPGLGRLRVVHLAPEYQALDVHVDDESAPNFSVDYREGSHAAAAIDLINLKFSPRGGGVGAAVIDTNVRVRLDTLTTVMLIPVPERTLPRVQFFRSEGSKLPNEGFSSLRMINAAEDPTPLDLGVVPQAGGNLRFDLGLGTFVDYVPVLPGPAQVTVYGGPDDTVIVEAMAHIPEGRLISLIVTGSEIGGGLALSLLFDDDTTEQKPLLLLRDPAGVDRRATFEQRSVTFAPNPASDHARLSYSLEHAGHVRVELHDIGGNHVRTLANEHQAGVEHFIMLDVSGLASGTYTLTIARDGEGVVAVKQIVVVR